MKEQEEEFYVRRGKGISWRMVGHYSVTSGYTIDDLDSKQLDEANDNYEKIFILVRSALEQNESRCMDVEEDRLQICQVVTDCLKKYGFTK